MDSTLLFGVAYYLEYMPYNRVVEDIQMMKQAGMNVVRIAESTWSTLEPEDGVFNFQYIDRVLEEVEKVGMKAIIGTPTYAIPAWLAHKEPDIMVTNKKGRSIYGHRQLININNDVFLKYAERVIRKLIAYTAQKECVIGFQIDNETKHYENYAESVQLLFKKYLIEKFETTEKLNKTFGLAYWSNAIHNWDDLLDMRGCINGGLASEFEKFQRHMAEHYLGWQAKIVSQYKRIDQFVTHNFDFEWKKIGAPIAQDGYSYGVQPDIDHYEAAKYLTMASTDIYHPTQDQLTGAEIAFGGDEIRCLKNTNYLVAECQAQAFKYFTPYPGQLRLHAYSHLASGANGIMYWNWHSIHNGYETYWKGLLSHDLKVNKAYEEACVIGKEWQQLKDVVVPLKKHNNVALVIDNKCLTAFKWFPIDKDLTYNDVVRWMYDSLYEMNIECDVVHIETLDPQKYKVIITPALYSIYPQHAKKLREFVYDGGILISSFKSFVADEHLSVYYDTQPYLLNESFGIAYNQVTHPGRTKIQGEKVEYIAELLELKGAESIADYEHPYWSEYAGITKHHYGKGMAYYIGCYTSKDILKSIYREALGYGIGLENILDVSWPIIVRSGYTREDKRVHYILHYSEESRIFKCPYKEVKDVMSNKIYYKDDEIALKDWDVLILEEVVE